MTASTQSDADSARRTPAQPVHPTALQQRVRELLSKAGSDEARVVLVRAAPQWDGSHTRWQPFATKYRTAMRAEVITAVSPLAVVEQVSKYRSENRSDLLVILTDAEERELGEGLLSLVFRNKVYSVELWEAVRTEFGAAGIAPDLRTVPWAAEALLDAKPAAGWPRTANSTLSRHNALLQLAARRLRLQENLGIGPDNLDINALFQWSLLAGAPESFAGLRSVEFEGLADFLAERTGPAGSALMALLKAGNAKDAVALGLIFAAFQAAEKAPGAPAGITARARGRADRLFETEPGAAVPSVSDMDTEAFGAAASEFVGNLVRTDHQQALHVLGTARTLIQRLGAEEAAAYSRILPEGIERQFAIVAERLRSCLAAGPDVAVTDPSAVRGLGTAIADLRQHSLAEQHSYQRRITRAEMAQRLVRWLASAETTDFAAYADRAMETASAGIGRHVAEWGWVDAALGHIYHGQERNPGLSAAYADLRRAVRVRRRGLDRVFAERLAAWTAAGTDPGRLLTVETFVPRVIAPLTTIQQGAKAASDAVRPVLFLVLDGMSAAAAVDLSMELEAGWAEYDPLGSPDETPRRRGMAAALPTLTGASRASLFAAELAEGGQDYERRRFQDHKFGTASARRTFKLFHKMDLRGDSGAGLGSDVVEALGDQDVDVAIVLNTIDENLAKDRPRTDWRIEDVAHLRDVLDAAAWLGRVLIITSDHGHVLDREAELRRTPNALSARHRSVDGEPPQDGEVELFGPRVLAPGHRVIALWDEDVRYTDHKGGYHGGASLAEVSIPILAYLPFGAVPPRGWRQIGDPRPVWWKSDPAPVRTSASTALALQRNAPATPVKKPTPQKQVFDRGVDELFALSELMGAGEARRVETGVVLDVPNSQNGALIDEFLASEMYAYRRRTTPRAVPSEKIAKALDALLHANGVLPITALAERSGERPDRASGFAATLQRLLNYDEVQVLEVLDDGRTLRLHGGLLRSQFDLSPEAS